MINIWTEEEVSVLKENYGLVSINDISRMLSRHDYTSVKNKLRWLNMSRGYRRSVNESFFKLWSPEMAWCLGLICTDGNVYSQINVITGEHVTKCCVIASVDRALIDKFSGFIESTYRVSHCYHRGRSKESKPFFRVSITNSTVYDDLLSLGITENKSLTIDWIGDKVPEQFMPDFIRGLWDGDGCLGLDYDKYLRCVFVSGSENFIRGFSIKLSSILSTSLTYYNMGSAFCIRLCGKNARRFCRYIYYNDMGSSYLDRKYQKWLRYKRIRGI